jgi:curved DNA-binding protein CbpA
MRQNDFDPFIILGVSRTARYFEIRKKYLELCKKHHSDKDGDHEKVMPICLSKLEQF